VEVIATPMMELTNFYNKGFGWICRQCERDLAPQPTEKTSRLFHEGEAESKQPQLSNRALAKWVDAAQRTLFCPRCGISETVEKS
jgi:hypothetical protein